MSNPSFFSEKPFYRPEEIDRMCIDELSKVDLLPTAPEPIRVERFIEKRFNVTPVYEELPEGVLGFIEFCSKGVKGITVSRSLSEEDSIVAERRIKTTLAHEVGHGLLHTHLFILGRNPEPLFDEDINSKKPKILCRNNTIQGIQEVNGSNYSWWEYQANMVIGALLLPKMLFLKASEPFMVKEGKMGLKTLDLNRKKEAIRVLSDVFDVNPVVVEIRLKSFFSFSQNSQLTL